MAVVWRAPGLSRERILAYGGEGTGKSRGALQIARRCRDVTAYIVDNDNAIDRLLEAEFTELGVRELNGEETGEEGNVVLWQTDDWDEHVAAIAEATKRAERDDWLIIDGASALWDDVQKWFAETVFGDQLDQYLLNKRLAVQRSGEKAKNLNPFEGLTDWSVINPVYKRNVMSVLVKPPCHLYVTAEQQEVRTGEGMRDDRQTREMYGGYGMRPRAQKRVGHNVQTVLWLQRSRTEEWRMTTVKDRGREVMRDEGWEDFARDYLQGVAGWRPRKIEAGKDD